MEASLPGFRTFVQTGIVLEVNASPGINPVLQVGQVSEQVEVQANAALVETRSVGVGQVMENVADVRRMGAAALDLADASRLGGGLNNVATVLGELAEDDKFDRAALMQTAEQFPLSTQRRLGYLLECVGAVELAAVLPPLAERFGRSATAVANATVGLTAVRLRWNDGIEPEGCPRAKVGVDSAHHSIC
jgi:hypothetical protein